MAGADEASGQALRGKLLRRAGRFILAFALFALMLVTVIDVIGRDLFNSPLRGGYELSGLLLMVLFFISFPFATARGEHIFVGLIDSVVGDRTLRLLNAFVALSSAIALAVLTYFVLQKGLASLRYQEATMFLRLPLGYFTLLGAGSLGLTSLVLLWRFVTVLRRPVFASETDDA